MKRIILSLLIGLAIYGFIPVPAFAQVQTTPYQYTLWLNKDNMQWSSDSLNSCDTITVATRTYTLPVQVNGGWVSVEGKAIFTAGTDSMKGVIYGSNYANGFTLPLDTMRLFPLDSFKLLASGSGVGTTMRGTNFKYNAVLSGKYSVWITLQLSPLNGTTGKLTQISIGRQ